MGERIGRVKMGKLMYWDKASLIGKAKTVCTSISRTRDSFTTSHQQAGVQLLQESHNGDSARWKPHSKHPPFSLSADLYSEHEAIWHGAFLGLLGVNCPSYPLPASCAPPAHLLLGWDERQKRPWCSASSAQQECKHAINTASNTNTKQARMPATKKINSIPDRTSTEELPLLPS